jgi:hypothetical protein
VVYILDDDPASRAASVRVLTESEEANLASGGLVGHCALAGCLLPLALEHLASVAPGRIAVADRDNSSNRVMRNSKRRGSLQVDDLSGEHSCGGRESEQNRNGGMYAPGWVDFLLPQHHFQQWASAARSGAFQELLSASSLPRLLILRHRLHLLVTEPILQVASNVRFLIRN